MPSRLLGYGKCSPFATQVRSSKDGDRTRAPAALKTKITTHDEIIPEDKMRESLLVESFTNLGKSVLDDHLLITHHIVTALPSHEQQIV